VRARYVIACDGGSSTVRTLLDMPLEDLDFDEPWLVVDVLVNERGLAKLPKVSVQYCEPERPCTLVIGPKNHRRWEISLKPGEDPKQVATEKRPGSCCALAHAGRRRAVAPGELPLPRAGGRRWRTAACSWPAMRRTCSRPSWARACARACATSPTWRGSWRGAARRSHRCRGGPLLDSYGTERKAHVRELTSRIKAIGAVICERDADKARARDAKLLADCGGVVKDTPRQDVLPRLEGGCLSAHDTTGRGTLFPQPRLADALVAEWAAALGLESPVPA
jgi:3-(3-hydroxy-phenyl)propionate hydroxylase